MLDGNRFCLETKSLLSHAFCPAWQSGPTAAHALAGLTIVLACLAIPTTMQSLTSGRRGLATSRLFLFVSPILIIVGALPHLAALIVSGNPLDGFGRLLRAGTDAVAGLTVAGNWMLVPAALKLHGRKTLGRRSRSFTSALIRRHQARAELDQIKAEFEAQLQERTRELELKAQALEKMNANLSHYAHCASHDLQEPLRKIVAFAEIAVEQDKSGDPNLALYLDKINEAARRARTLVREILRHAELDRHRLELRELSLRAEIGKVLESLELPIGERQGRIETDIDDITVLADPTLVSQVIQNLVANALKYTPTERLPHIHLKAARAGDGASFTIEDNGMGFDPAFSDRIFEPFTRLHAGVGVSGTGMGLAIVTKALALLGWSISVNTEESKGTRFVIRIPEPHLVAAAASPLPAAPAQ